MKLVVSPEQSAVGWQKFVFFCLLLTAYCSLSCSIPNLEKPECAEARQTVKDFYSFHFGNDMKFTKENLQPLMKFLSEELSRELENQSDDAKDYFTATDDYPKAFRVGACQVIEPDKKADIQVLLFWKDEQRNEQREVKTEVIKESDKWLINKIKN